MKRYRVIYKTYMGITGHAVIEQKIPMTEEEVKERVDRDLSEKNCHDWVTEISIGEMSVGASLASKILIIAANLFLKK